MRVLQLTRYGGLGASSRLRSLQYAPWLQTDACQCTMQPLFSDEMLSAKYRKGDYELASVIRAYAARVWQLLQRHQFDLVWIEKEALPWMPAWFERILLRGVPYVLDYDDAVFHNYDRHHSAWVRVLLGRRLDRLMAKATLVVCGNSYLAQRATDAGAPWVEIVPTVINLERYPSRVKPVPDDVLPVSAEPLRIVWIGSPSTVRYLELLRVPLQELASQRPFVLRVIGGTFEIQGVDVECVTWTEDTEVASIAACDVGIMPLADTPWERGKCGYKLIQYMACGLPVVASNVGANPEIVGEGVNGFLAQTDEDWVKALKTLLDSAALRAEMGAKGRHLVEEKYCIQKTGPVMAQLMRVAAEKGAGSR